MINNKGKVKVSPGIEYVNDWRDHNGQYQIERYVSSGRVIINKMVTGCGFTTYCMCNSEDTILIAPRLRLIQDKFEQANKNSQECYYFNREKDRKGNQLKSIDDLRNEFQSYRWVRKCNNNPKPFKILVTYDSFCCLADLLEKDFNIDISKEFRIAIDESHSLIKDVKLKEFHNKCVLSQFIARLFTYDNLLFISATPIVHYIEFIPEFQNNSVDYYELEWSNVTKVIQKPYKCKSAKDAFDQIYRHYNNNGCFDAKYNVGAYSTEAVIFLNSVKDICSILNKYIAKNKLINVNDVTIICADNKENRALIHKVDKGLHIIKSIPKYGDPHTTWTFVTRTAFEGVDFYSPCASTFVIANYYIPSLSLDIASDIPQIIGRQRRKDNLFRDTIHIYYVNNKNVVDDNEFVRFQNEKIRESNNQIGLCKTAHPTYQVTAFNNLKKIIEADPNYLYVTTVNGVPEINNLLIISEQYCRDILKNQVGLFVIISNASGTIYRMEVQQLKKDLANVSSYWVSEERMRIIAGYFQKYPSLTNDIFEMLRNEGYNQLGYYFSQLPIDRMQANRYRMSDMDQEIAFRNQTQDIGSIVASIFVKGQVYSKAEVKKMLQDVYDRLGLKKKAKATEISNYIPCESVKKDGLKAVRII